MDILVKSPQLKKHVATVHITNEDLGLLARKVYTVLIYHAFPFLRKKRKAMHSIPLAELREGIGWTEGEGMESRSNNNQAIKEAIQFLQTTLIETNHTDRHWASVQFLGRSEIKDGIIYYSFDDWVAEQLANPEVYARINIGVIGLIRESRYSLALYENCARYRPNKAKGFPGEVTWKMDEFRQIMGVASKSSYHSYKDLKKRVLHPAIKEVNSLTDLIVTATPIKAGREYVAIKFLIKENPQLSLDLLPSIEVAEQFADHPLMTRFGRLGVAVSDAIRHLSQHGEDKCLEIVEWAEEKSAKGEIRKSAAGFIAKALSEGWGRPASADDVRRELEAKEQQTKETARLEKQRQASLEEAKKELESEYNAFLADIAMRRFDLLPEPERQAFIEQLAERNTFYAQRIQTEGMKSSAVRVLLVVLLENAWNLKEEFSLESWQQESGYRIEETATGARVVCNKVKHLAAE